MLLAMLTAVPGSVADQGCDLAAPRGFAFARVGPLRVTAEPHGQTGWRVAARFARAYPVFAADDRAVGLCIDGRRVWARRAHVLEVSAPQWVGVPEAADTATRPMLRFWRGQERLGAHLSRDSTAQAPPDYEEVAGADVVGSVRFPVFNRDIMEMTLDNRQLEVASVLVPFQRDAVVAYRALRGLIGANAIVVVDQSGSTVGLIEPLLRDLQLPRPGPGEPTPRLLLIGVGGDGALLEAEQRPMTDLLRRDRPHRPAPDGAAGDATSRGFATVARQLARVAGDRPVLLLAGGDVALNAADWAGFGPVSVVQPTPELQDRLRRSAAELGGDPRFLPFAAGNGERLRRILSGQAGTPAPEVPRREDYAPIAALGARPGMVGLLPRNLEASDHLAAPPAFAADGADWFAIPLWVVVDGLLLRFEGGAY